MNLPNEINTMLRHKEILWKQKSKIQWLNEGDRNTKFFYTSTSIRRGRNHIDRLNINGSWTNNLNLISNHVNNYFNDLFRVDFSFNVQNQIHNLDSVKFVDVDAPSLARGC